MDHHHLAFMSKMFPKTTKNQDGETGKDNHARGSSATDGGVDVAIRSFDTNGSQDQSWNSESTSAVIDSFSGVLLQSKFHQAATKTDTGAKPNLTIATTGTGIEGKPSASRTPVTEASTPSTLGTLHPPIEEDEHEPPVTNAVASHTDSPENGTQRLPDSKDASPLPSTTAMPAKLLATHCSPNQDVTTPTGKGGTSTGTDEDDGDKSPSCSSRLFQGSGKAKASSELSSNKEVVSQGTSSISARRSTSISPSKASRMKNRKKPPRTSHPPKPNNTGATAPPTSTANTSPRRGIMRRVSLGGRRSRSISAPRAGRDETKDRGPSNSTVNSKNGQVLETRPGPRSSIDNSTITMEEFVHKSSRMQSFLGHAWQHVKHATVNSNREEATVANPQGSKALKKKRRRRGSLTAAKATSAASVVPEPGQRSEVMVQEPANQGADSEGGASRFIREQTTEIWRLKQQLEQAQEEVTSLKSTHDNLRIEFQASQNRAQRAQTALRLAQDSVRSARAEADAAETTAAHLAQQLQDLHTVVEETKKASLLLQQEQEMVEKKVNRAETALHHKGLELSRAHNKLTQHQKQDELFHSAQNAWDRQQETLQAQLTEKMKLLHTLEQQHHESNALAEARLERLQKMQDEWQQAQSLLEEATQSKLETQQTVVQLSEAIEQLQLANGTLHKQLESAQSSNHEQKTIQQEALYKAERATLQARIQQEALEEELTRLQHQIKQQQQQHQQIQRRAARSSVLSTKNDSADHVVPRFSLPPLSSSSSVQNKGVRDNNDDDKENGAPATPAGPRRESMTATPLASKKNVENRKSANDIADVMATPTTSNCTKRPVEMNDAASETGSTVSRASVGAVNNASKVETCTICGGMAYGLMKRCQCGRVSCSFRAHLSCANQLPLSSKASLSHPGAPTVRTALVLCQAVPDSGSCNIEKTDKTASPVEASGSSVPP